MFKSWSWTYGKKTSCLQWFLCCDSPAASSCCSAVQLNITLPFSFLKPLRHFSSRNSSRVMFCTLIYSVPKWFSSDFIHLICWFQFLWTKKNENTPLKFPLIIINRQQGTFFSGRFHTEKKLVFFQNLQRPVLLLLASTRCTVVFFYK